MSNRNTKVYDELLVKASTSNEDICNNLNLSYDASNTNDQCVEETKYYVNSSNPIKSNSSNLNCVSSNNATSEQTNEQKLVVVKTQFQRPWTRFTAPCVYSNNNINNTFNKISNNIKKLNVRRKAEILQYKQGNRLTKAEKYSNFSRGTNKYNKKQITQTI